jgi:hypothetical protein
LANTQSRTNIQSNFYSTFQMSGWYESLEMVWHIPTPNIGSCKANSLQCLIDSDKRGSPTFPFKETYHMQVGIMAQGVCHL